MMQRLIIVLLGLFVIRGLMAQDTYNQIDEMGNVTQRNQNFNKHNNDTTSKNKEVPKGMKTWTVDEQFGDRTAVAPDTLPYMYMNTVFTEGLRGEYNTTGNQGSPRLSRLFMNRQQEQQFIFTNPSDFRNVFVKGAMNSSGSVITDGQIKKYLSRKGYDMRRDGCVKVPKNVLLKTINDMMDGGIKKERTETFDLRPEQREAVDMTWTQNELHIFYGIVRCVLVKHLPHICWLRK